MYCERCKRQFSYAVPRSDNKDQRLCVGCCKHLRAGGAWSMVAPSTPPRAKVTESSVPPFRSTLLEHVKRGCRRIHCPTCG
jgi:hypothetical protein